jgi:hypothetical protein
MIAAFYKKKGGLKSALTFETTEFKMPSFELISL